MANNYRLQADIIRVEADDYKALEEAETELLSHWRTPVHYYSRSCPILCASGRLGYDLYFLGVPAATQSVYRAQYE